MLTRYRTHLLCLCFLLLGILIGGALIALVPHHNTIHLSVMMPYQGVNISPEVGDTIEWATYGHTTPPTIAFSPFTGSPCKDKTPGSTCVYDDSGDGIHIYTCSGSARCDPGVGPSSGTRGGGGVLPILRRFAEVLQGLSLSFDRGLGLIGPAPALPPASPSPGGQPEPTEPLGPQELRADGPDAEVGCIGNKTSISNATIAKPVGQFVSWVGGSPFSVAVDPLICQGNTSTPGPLQSCKLLKTAPATAYTITDASCTAQPTLNTPTISATTSMPTAR